jgi:hypothetical protein
MSGGRKVQDLNSSNSMGVALHFVKDTDLPLGLVKAWVGAKIEPSDGQAW